MICFFVTSGFNPIQPQVNVRHGKAQPKTLQPTVLTVA